MAATGFKSPVSLYNQQDDQFRQNHSPSIRLLALSTWLFGRNCEICSETDTPWKRRWEASSALRVDRQPGQRFMTNVVSLSEDGVSSLAHG